MRRRICAISDLHIGGGKDPMLGHPEVLVSFLHTLACLPRQEDEELELVIHGDFIDFLAEEEQEAWTATERGAENKLDNVVKRQPDLFKAFSAATARVDRLTILLGNHDVELAYPCVRERLFKELGTTPHRCLFVGNNEAYRVGELLIEHGNRYDSWNAIDHDGLRQTMSCASRGESAPRSVAICPGSQFVHQVMNPLKERYHFIDLLKPEDKVVVLLLSAFEPGLKTDLSIILPFARSYIRQYCRKAIWKIRGDGITPTAERFVSAKSDDSIDAELATAFQEELANDRQDRVVGLGARLRRLFITDTSQSLRTLLETGGQIEPKRVRKLQLALARKIEHDTSFEESDATGSCAEAASAILETGCARVVIMGHTHLRREIRFGDHGRYVNTGTWADLLRIDPAHLEDTNDGRAQFVDWLRRLVTNQLTNIRECHASYASVSMTDDLRVALDDDRPLLRRYKVGDALL